MLKKFLAAIMIALPALGFAQAKFGVVNTQPIIEAMPEMKDATTQLEAASKKYQDEYKNFTDEFNKKVAEVQELQNDASTPKLILERKMKDIQDLQTRIEEFRQTADRDLQRQQEQLFAPIQQKVSEAITAVGKEGSFTFIFESMVPVYVGVDVTDVTDLVKGKLGVK